MKKTWSLILRASLFREKIITPADQLQTNKFCNKTEKRLMEGLKHGKTCVLLLNHNEVFLAGKEGE